MALLSFSFRFRSCCFFFVSDRAPPALAAKSKGGAGAATMPSRSRAARGPTLHPVSLDDFFRDGVEIDFSEEDQEEEPEDDGGSEEEGEDDGGSEEEGEDDVGSEEDESQGSSDDDEDDDEEEEEELEREEFGAGDCGPSAQARVSSVAAAGGSAERANMPTCPVCMEPWTSQGPHRIR